MESIRTRAVSFLVVTFLCMNLAQSAERNADVLAQQAGSLLTPVRSDNLDPATFTQWLDGAEKPIKPTDSRGSDGLPNWVLWTDKTTPGHSGLAFGASKSPGPRHLRIGLKAPATIGSILVRGGAQVSVLKPDAAYPGDMSNESNWIPAERIKDGAVGRDEGVRDSYTLWVLPKAVPTRAIRFTHIAQVMDKDYAGWLGGAYVLADRYANLAPQAMPVASVNQNLAKKVVNERHDADRDLWANLTADQTERPEVVSAQSPESLMFVWPAEVKVRGLGAVFVGFGEAEAQAYAGPADVHPREAPESAWKTIRTFTGLKNRYPVSLPVDWLDFGQEVTTRAIRLKITKAAPESSHPHMHGHTKDGKRVWLGELMAISSLGSADLKSATLPATGSAEKPPIAVKFTLPESGWVTLVIEDAAGQRVRNLIADTFFERGENTAWWDGSDDLGRDPSAASHGLYYIPTQLVGPGEYRVRGLWRKQIDLKYEMSFYNAGKTSWETADKTGGWLSNHTPPSAVLFVPDAPSGEATRETILIGSYVSEGTAGLAWVDLDGNKWKGQGWVGGTWTGAPHLARDAGTKAVPGIYAYAAAAWDAASDKKERNKKGEIRITGLTSGQDKPIGKYPFDPVVKDHENVSWEAQIGGVAVHDGVVVVAMPSANQLLFVKSPGGEKVAEARLDSPHGLCFDKDGRLLAASGNRIVRFASIGDPAKMPAPKVLVQGLEDPRGITLDSQGNLYVADRGKSHQVKVFAPDGKPIRTIGKPGEPQAGPYDPLRMNNPRGVSIDSRGRLWVAEEDVQPKRISVWSTEGTLLKAYYGPVEYGGGGSLDPQDRTRFYYAGMEFKLDWEKGKDQLVSVYYRRKAGDLKLPFRSGPPQSAVYVQGRRYWHNSYNSNPTGGHGSAFIFADRNGIAVPCAGAGRANDWDLLKTDAFASVWPQGTDPKANPHTQKAAFFIWSDLNGDGQVQPNEVKLTRGTSGGVTVMRDLSFAISRLDGKAVRFPVPSFTGQGVPVYSIDAAKTLIEDVNTPPSSGGDQLLTDVDGWTIHTTAPRPYKGSAVAGSKDGVAKWSYPSLWPGLHASHEAPVPDRPGMIIGHTRLLGDPISTAGAGAMWIINGNHGPFYVFTADGLFVAQLMQDMRVGRPWAMPVAQRGMLLNELTPHDENFWPGVTQTADGAVYIVSGGASAIMRVEGLETVRRLPESKLSVTAQDLDRARDYFAKAEAARQAAQGRGSMLVTLRKTAPVIDGKLDDWAKADWADIDKRGVAAYFNSKSKPYDVTGAMAVAGDRLYAAWRTGDKDLLKNAGDVPNSLFKTGGALDLMIGTNASADSKRSSPVDGDLRLLVSLVNNKPRALVYRAVTSGEKKPVPFSSPWRTITFDRVDDVSDQVKLAGTEGNYEISIPLAALGLKPAPGMQLRGDIGILRGTGTTTTQRVYWSNKATSIVADVPSEAELQPRLWGRLEFKPE